MPKKTIKQLQEENAELKAKIMQLSALKDNNNDSDCDSDSDTSSKSSSKSRDSKQTVGTTKFYEPPNIVSGGAVKAITSSPPISTNSNDVDSKLKYLESLVGDLVASIAKIEARTNTVNYDFQEPTNVQFYTPAPRFREEKSPSVLTESVPPSTRLGTIASDMSKDNVSQNWTNLAATANAITKQFNEDTGILVAPIDYKDMERYTIVSFDIIAVARKLITIKRYINNRPLKLLDIIAFISEDIKPFVLRAYHQQLVASKVPRATLFEEHELLQCLRASNDLGALIRAVAINLDANETADYLLVLSKVRFWPQDYEAIMWSYLDASILVNWMFALVREIIQLGILQFDDFEQIITAHDILKIVLGTIKTPTNPLTTFITKFEKTSKAKYKQWSLLASIEDAQKTVVEYCRAEEASGYYQFVKATNKFALKIYFRHNYGKGRVDGKFFSSKYYGENKGNENKSFSQSPTKRPWNSSSPSRVPLLAALDVAADPYEYFDLYAGGDDSENEDEVSSVVSAAEVTEDSEMLLAALTGTDKAKLPCFAHFKAQRIHTESGTIEISDNTGCVRGADCQYSHDVRDRDVVAKFASAISKRLVQKK